MCDCIQEINKSLREQGLQLHLGFRLTGNIPSFIPIATEKIDPKDRKIKTVTLLGAYCPICGDAIK